MIATKGLFYPCFRLKLIQNIILKLMHGFPTNPVLKYGG